MAAAVVASTAAAPAEAAPLGAKPSAGPKTALAPDVPARIVDPKTNTVYHKGDLLGTGGFAWVYEVRSADGGEPAAVKVVSKAALSKHKARDKLAAEIRIHRSLKHTHVVDFRHFFEDAQNVYILLELCESQTLAQLVKRRKRLTEPEVAYFMLQLLAAVQYLHQRHVIHRDLKLGNLFLTRDLAIRVGDFGLATVVNHDGERKRTLCGTPNYIAPEVLDDHNGHSYEVDIWSLGVIMYTMLVGRPPFETAQLELTYAKIRNNDYTFPAEVPVSSHARSLIRWLLQPLPEERPTLEEIYGSAFLTHTRPPTSLPPSVRHIEPILLPSSYMAPAPTPSVPSAPSVAKENHEIQGVSKKSVSSMTTVATTTTVVARRGLATLDTNVLAAELGRARLDAKEDPAPKPVRSVFAASATAALGGTAPSVPAATEDRRPLAARLSAGAPAAGTTRPTAPLPARASAGAKPTTTTKGARGRASTRTPLPVLCEDTAPAPVAATAPAPVPVPVPDPVPMVAAALEPTEPAAPIVLPMPVAAPVATWGRTSGRARPAPDSAVAMVPAPAPPIAVPLPAPVPAAATSEGAEPPVATWGRASGRGRPPRTVSPSTLSPGSDDNTKTDTAPVPVPAPAPVPAPLTEDAPVPMLVAAPVQTPVAAPMPMPVAVPAHAPASKPPTTSAPMPKLASTPVPAPAPIIVSVPAPVPAPAPVAVAGAVSAKPAPVRAPAAVATWASAPGIKKATEPAAAEVPVTRRASPPAAPVTATPTQAPAPRAVGALAAPAPAARPLPLPVPTMAAMQASVPKAAGPTYRMPPPPAVAAAAAAAAATVTVPLAQPRPVTSTTGTGVGAPAEATSTSVMVELHALLVRALDGGSRAPPSSGMAVAVPPPVWVTKWVDYSTKYGLGYQLTGGHVGVLFNDLSSLVFLPGGQAVEYMANTKTPGVKAEVLPLPAAHRAHQKKMALLLYFKAYIDDMLSKEGVRRPEGAMAAAPENGHPRVSRWYRTKHALLFRLSNGVFQFNFQDRSKLVLAHGTAGALYLSPTRQAQTVHLDAPPAGDEELLRRLRYARDVFAHLLAAPSASTAAQAAGPDTRVGEEEEDENDPQHEEEGGASSSPGGL